MSKRDFEDELTECSAGDRVSNDPLLLGWGRDFCAPSIGVIDIRMIAAKFGTK